MADNGRPMGGRLAAHIVRGMARLLREGRTVSETARLMGVTRKTVRKYRKNFLNNLFQSIQV